MRRRSPPSPSSGTTQNALSLPIFLVASVALSVLIAVIYNGTGGSVLLCFLAHWMSNSTGGQFTGNEMGFTALVMGLVAITLVLVLGAKKLSATKVTEPLDIPWDEDEAPVAG